jgi:hypothetical protein
MTPERVWTGREESMESKERSGVVGLKGVLAAVLTPMDEDLNPGHQAFAAHCHRLLAAGCHGLSVFGTTGEANYLSVNEQLAALEAGTAGAPVLPPFYYKGVGDDGLFRFFAEVVERVGDLIVTKTLSGSRQVEQHVGADQLDQCQPVLRLLGPASTQAATPPKPYGGGVG